VIVGVGVVNASAVTEVLDGLTRVLGAAEQHGVGALGGAKGKLIEGDALTASLDDSGAGSLGEAKGSDLQAGQLQLAGVVGDGTNNNGSLVLLALKVSRQARDRDGGIVDLGLSQSLDNDSGELGISTTSNEAANTSTQDTDFH
jgi:hypothetical protein